MTDAVALPLLTDAMEAAGQKDLPGFLTLLDQAHTTLGKGRHTAKPTIAQARRWAADGRWDAAWGACHQAMCDLTWIFPPDIRVCPTRPSARSGSGPIGCPGCGATTPADARFCPACGTPLPGTD